MQQRLQKEPAQTEAPPDGRPQVRWAEALQSTLKVLRLMRLLQPETSLSISSTPSGIQPELRAARAAHHRCALNSQHLACRLAKRQYLSIRSTYQGGAQRMSNTLNSCPISTRLEPQ